MKLVAENFRRLQERAGPAAQWEPSQPIRVLDGSPMILIRADGTMSWARTRTDKDAMVQTFNPDADVLLWVWRGQYGSDVFRLSDADVKAKYR